MLSEEKVAPCYVRQTISWSSNESNREHENIALKSTTAKQLRAIVCKNQTNSKFRGKGEKFDFFLILILDRLDYN